MKTLLKLLGIAVMVVIILEVYHLSRPLPAATASTERVGPAVKSVDLPWPSTGQAAIGTAGDGLLTTHGRQTAVPIASTAKLVTALAVLSKKPLLAGQQGPIVTLGPADVRYYQDYVAVGGSVALVANGEQISEYQLLEAMLLPSANNIAQSLASWAFGSVSGYTAYANQYVKTLGLSQTHLDDASGFSPQTLGSAADLVRLAKIVMDNPVLAGIVAKRSAVVPVAGTIHNVNHLLGQDGVVGIKTGNTDQAGGCLVFAAKRSILGQSVTIIGAIAGDSSLGQAMADGRQMIVASDKNFRLFSLPADTIVGSYRAAWGAESSIITAESTSWLLWNGQSISAEASFKKLSTAAAGEDAGNLRLSAGDRSRDVPVQVEPALPGPPLAWRLKHF